MIPQRAAGILLHITSLPGEFCVGDLGASARVFVDFLVRSKQSCWQMLPLSPTVHGDSPYSCYSAFAGNPLLISISDLLDESLLTQSQVEELQSACQASDPHRSDYRLASDIKQQALRWAFSAFQMDRSRHQAEFDAFCDSQALWLTDFALFAGLMRHFSTDDWTAWEPALARREASAMGVWRDRLSAELQFEQFVQFLFYKQYWKLREYAGSRGIHLFGDMPIFVAHGSADVWGNQDIFHLDESGHQTVVAGVPPDYFSESGQLWGNPLYDWQRLQATGYEWWIRRLEWAFKSFDLLRIDHFRGFESYWEVPADVETAVSGQWVPGPGAALFRATEAKLGKLPIVAEDLGLITDAVHELRHELDFPGMRVLQFGFDDDADAYHRPDEYPEHSVAYTGTHDNQTVLSWFESRVQDPAFAHRINSYLSREDVSQPLHLRLLASVSRSRSRLAVAPLQDALGLHDQARMNRPGQAKGNWTWRCSTQQLSSELSDQLCRLTEESGRSH